MGYGNGTESDNTGALGGYGVVIVPPVGNRGSWLITLASWDEEAEAYGASTDGPLLDTREEALHEAGKVLDWLDEQGGNGDLAKIWEQMQERRGAEEGLNQTWRPSTWRPWNI
jgi:hypothetical protein